MLTDFGALTAAQKKLWSEVTWVQGRDQQFWYATGMMGSGNSDDNKPIHLVTELTKDERGDRCVMQLVKDMQGDGIVGDNELEGNEEQLFNDEQEIAVDQLRNAIKNKGKMSEQRTVLRFRALARNKLSFWLADKLDELTFLTASGRAYTLKTDGSTRSASSQLPQLAFAASVSAATSNRVLHAGAATSEGSITAADTMSWNFIVKAGALARWRRLKPVRMDGKDCYAIVMTPQQARDLKTDPNYQTNVGRAASRGMSNPLFKGSFAEIDGIYLFEHPKVFNTTGLASASKWGAGGLVEGAQAIMLGAQGLGFARIGDPNWAESDNKDYDNKQGVGYGRMIGLLKPQFESVYDNNTAQDFGLIQLKTAAAQ